MSRKKHFDTKFQYYREDCACLYCAYYNEEKHGCILRKCCCEDIKQEAKRSGRIKRKLGMQA